MSESIAGEEHTIVKLVEPREAIPLPAPALNQGMPLLTALKKRKSTHEFATGDISDRQLGALLWAANGVNREVSDRGRLNMRTAPSAKNHQEIEIYVFLRSGIYLYEAVNHRLLLVVPGDHRKDCGLQAFYAEVPVALCLVANFDKTGNYSEKKREFYAGIDTGYVSQNIYLYCASENLATSATGFIERNRLRELLKISNGKAMISHPVGKMPEMLNL